MDEGLCTNCKNKKGCSQYNRYVENGRKKEDEILMCSKFSKSKIGQVKEFYQNNKELINAVIPAAIGLTTEIVGLASVIYSKNMQDKKILDRSMGYNYELKRKLKNKEILQISERRKAGEQMGHILYDMRVLK